MAVARLRAMDVPLAKVAAYLAAESPDAARRVLGAHLADVEARTARNQLTMHGLRRIIDQKEDLVNTTAVAPEIDRDTRRRLAVDLFNHTWTLLETEGRTVEQDDEMVHAAHASRYHWGEVGDASNLARGEWQCARVYSVLGRAEPTLHHAGRCLEICQKNGIGDWDLAAAYEAMARASRVAGDDTARLRYLALARDACEDIADPEDRKIIESDLATLA